MEIQQDIRTYISSELGRSVDGLGNGDSLLEAGVVDSIGVMSIVAFIETHYGVKVADDDLMPENFDSLDAIAAFVAAKRGQLSA